MSADGANSRSAATEGPTRESWTTPQTVRAGIAPA
jgi:hypothetical protein